MSILRVSTGVDPDFLGTSSFQIAYRRIGDIAECAFVCNYFVANRDILQAIRWDEDLKADEHWDFFWRAKIAGVRVGVANRCSILRSWSTFKSLDNIGTTVN